MSPQSAPSSDSKSGSLPRCPRGRERAITRPQSRGKGQARSPGGVGRRVCDNCRRRAAVHCSALQRSSKAPAATGPRCCGRICEVIGADHFAYGPVLSTGTHLLIESNRNRRTGPPDRPGRGRNLLPPVSTEAQICVRSPPWTPEKQAFSKTQAANLRFKTPWREVIFHPPDCRSGASTRE